MKMLKKLAALILAATMVLVLFTACGGDTTSTPEAQAEAQMMSTINAKRQMDRNWKTTHSAERLQANVLMRQQLIEETWMSRWICGAIRLRFGSKLMAPKMVSVQLHL